jgi:hypothetical protein
LEVQMKAWTPKRREGKWRNFLTVDEAETVAQAERDSQAAREALAAATAVLNPSRQRASQRALHAERSGAK